MTSSFKILAEIHRKERIYTMETKGFRELNDGRKDVLTHNKVEEIRTILAELPLDKAIPEIMEISGGEKFTKGKEYGKAVIRELRGSIGTKEAETVAFRINLALARKETRDLLAFYDCEYSHNPDFYTLGDMKDIQKTVLGLTGIDEKGNFTKGYLIPMAVRAETLKCLNDGTVYHDRRIADMIVSTVSDAIQVVALKTNTNCKVRS